MELCDPGRTIKGQKAPKDKHEQRQGYLCCAMVSFLVLWTPSLCCGLLPCVADTFLDLWFHSVYCSLFPCAVVPFLLSWTHSLCCGFLPFIVVGFFVLWPPFYGHFLSRVVVSFIVWWFPSYSVVIFFLGLWSHSLCRQWRRSLCCGLLPCALVSLIL